MRNWRQSLKQAIYKPLPFIIATIGQAIVRLILSTCRWEIQGLEKFKEIAKKEKCILMLWHDCLAITPAILYKFAPHFIYAALVSKSRDGELINAVIQSYRAGRTIRVSHHARHQALREVIRYLEQKRDVIIITPDGPRGPRYKIKPGIALAAIETAAHVVPLVWAANRFWELKTWDRLKIPKPFSKIRVSFEPAVIFEKEMKVELQQAKEILQQALSCTF